MLFSNMRKGTAVCVHPQAITEQVPPVATHLATVGPGAIFAFHRSDELSIISSI